MKRDQRSLLLCLSFAALFTFLFHGTGIGLNLLLFEALVFGALLVSGRLPLKRDVLITTGGTLVIAVLVLLHGSALAITMNLISVLLAIGVLLAPELGALHHSAVLACSHLVAAQRTFLRSLPWPAAPSRALGITPRNAISGALVPLILLLFASLYSASNPYFAKVMADFYAWLGNLDASLPFVFLLGLVVCSFLLIVTRNDRLMRWANARIDALVPGSDLADDARGHALRSETRIGILLLGSLNVLLLLLNVLDIDHVWLNFHFTGQYLKQFVHEGTWLLILSIVLGALIVLYYFRGDLNFLSRNRVIKALSYAWLAQNTVLAVSVAIRNYWYIHHYALAFKRIGVVFFLLATVVCLVLIGLKVRHRRSHHFLIRWNVLSIYLVALGMSLFDWDTIIARYNMAQRERAFVELDFLATLGDKSLPCLVRSKLELQNLDSYNEHVLGGPHRYTRQLYMTPEFFAARINHRVDAFMKEYPERSWREWNAADAWAFRVLSAARNP